LGGGNEISLLQTDLVITTRSPFPVPPTQSPTPHTSSIDAVQVKSQPEDGPHKGPKHVVVFLLHY